MQFAANLTTEVTQSNLHKHSNHQNEDCFVFIFSL